MKGGLAAIIETTGLVIERQVYLRGDLIIAAVVDEEDKMKGSNTLV